MGVLFSFLPSIERNTMCCVDVRRRKPFWVSEPSVHESCRQASYIPASVRHSRKPKAKDNTPANEREYDATIDVYAPVDTDAMLKDAGFGAIRDRILQS